MNQPTQGRVVAGLLSMLIPGAGQLYAGAHRRGLLLIAISVLLVLGAMTAGILTAAFEEEEEPEGGGKEPAALVR